MNIQDWFCVNKLTLNVDKMVLMVFSQNQIPIKMSININDTKISQVHSTKFLGTWLDDKLSWFTHVTKLKQRLASRIGLLYKKKYFLSRHCMKILYFAQIYSILVYGISV